MKAQIMSVVGAAMIPVLAGCATKPVAIAPVGPRPASAQALGGTGFLKVYSDTETHEIGRNTFFYPHKPYGIYSESGKCLRFVVNHIGDIDESPTCVPLPAGRYVIVAESAAYGRVRVPVVIQGDLITSVHLDRDGTFLAHAPAQELVHLPDGEIVGWHS